MICFPVYFEGELIVYEGDVGREMYFIKRGCVDILMADSIDGDDDGNCGGGNATFADSIDPNTMVRTVSSLKPGDFFGELALLDNKAHKRTASAVASEITEAVVLKKLDFERLCDDYETLRELFVAAAIKHADDDVSRETCKE